MVSALLELNYTYFWRTSELTSHTISVISGRTVVSSVYVPSTASLGLRREYVVFVLMSELSVEDYDGTTECYFGNIVTAMMC